MKNFLLATILIIVTGVFLIPTNLFAATTSSIYVSPGVTNVINGNNVTVSVRINPNSNPVDSVQAVLNFDGSKLQYLSYSAGTFTTFQGNASASSFSYVGTLLGSSTASDSLMFSVTFKAIANGTSNLTLSGISSAYQGSAFSQTLSVNGSVSITTPATPPPAAPPANTNRNTPAAPVPESDTTAPKLVGEPVIVFDKTIIKIDFKTDENSKTYVKYSLGEEVKTLENTELNVDHSIIIGSDTPLSPGSTYKIEITCEDSLGNKSIIFVNDIRTTGVDYKVKITDSDGVVLQNHKVQLFSDPIETTTDQNGIAIFSDVTPGEHTLVFEIDGLVLRKNVVVSSDLVLLTTKQDSFETVALPVKFQIDNENPVAETNNTQNYLLVGVTAGLLGIAFASSLFLLREKGVWAKLRLKKSVKPILTK